VDLIFQVIVNSIIVGSLYGAVAMSFTLAYKTTRFFNLAHGAMGAIGGYIFFWLRYELTAGFALSLLGGMMAAGLTGFLLDRFFYAPLRKRKSSSVVLLVVSFGILAVAESLISMIFNTQFKPLGALDKINNIQLGSAFITVTQLWIIIVNILVFVGFLVLLHKTRFGNMVRAISDDAEVAHTLGIRTDFYIGISFFIAAAIAGLAGILTGLDTGLQPSVGLYLVLKAIIASIIGCMGSIPGAFLGGFLLAASENVGVFFVGSEWRDAIAFSLLLVFLAFRPQGILGGKKE
jgi:branched-chain amino acid transport system permease protein